MGQRWVSGLLIDFHCPLSLGMEREKKKWLPHRRSKRHLFANPQFEQGFTSQGFISKNVVVTWFELWGYEEGDKGVQWRGIGYLHSRRSSFGSSLTFTYVVTHSCISWVYLKHEKMIALICKIVWVKTEAHSFADPSHPDSFDINSCSPSSRGNEKKLFYWVVGSMLVWHLSLCRGLSVCLLPRYTLQGEGSLGNYCSPQDADDSLLPNSPSENICRAPGRSDTLCRVAISQLPKEPWRVNLQ